MPLPFFNHTTTNKMKKTDNWNNISKELTPPILKPGEVAVFRLLGIKGKPEDPDNYRCPSYKDVPSTDRIYDPYAQDYVDIANIESVGVGGQVNLRTSYFESISGGMITLKGGRIKDVELYQYLSLCNYNASNPNRSSDSPAIFERLNPVANAENKRKARSTRRQALNIAADMNANTCREFAAAMGWDDGQELALLRDRIEEYADSNPTEFIKKSKNKQNSLSALIARSQKAGEISFDSKTNSWKWKGSDEVICSVARGTDKVNILIEHLTSAPNGPEMIKTLQKATK